LSPPRDKKDIGTKGHKKDKRDKKDKNTGTKETTIQGQKVKKRSLISQIVKMQVHALWVKSDMGQ
jgi:hypothetical protein